MCIDDYFSIALNLLKQDYSTILADAKKWFLASVYGQGDTNNKRWPAIGAIWFLWAMFWGKCVFSFFSKSKFCFPVVVLLFAIGYVSSKYFYLPLSFQSGLTSMIFIYFGKRIKEYEILKENTLRTFITALELWIAMLLLNGGNMFIVVNYYNAIPASIVSGVCGSIVLLLFSKEIGNVCSLRPLKYIGKYSMIFLCVHILDLNLFPWGWFTAKFLSGCNYYLMLIVHFVVKMAMYYIGCFIILVTPLKFIYNPSKK